MIKMSEGTQNINHKSLLDLLDKDKKVVVPLIQRDYAQGRKGERYADIRKNILMDIKKCLENQEQEKLNLAFLYGEKKDNIFYPLDGQQRLTTLWLVHWYIWFNAYKSETNEADYKADLGKLSNFTYKTRESSSDFCSCMCDIDNVNDLIKAKENNIEANLAELIRSRTWFLSGWLNDPTIDAMLRTLSGDNDFMDACVEKIFDKVDYNTFKERLKDGRIVFDVLELNKNNSSNSNETSNGTNEKFIDSDDIYIKMNARGKPLSDFENLKSDLVDCISKKIISEENNNKKEFLPGIISKIDNEWTDIFWREIKEYNKNNKSFDNIKIASMKMDFDPMFFSFINRFVLNEICLAKQNPEDINEDNSEDNPENTNENNSKVRYALSLSSDNVEESKERKYFNKIYGTGLDGKYANDSKVTYSKYYFPIYESYLATEDNLKWLDKVFCVLKDDNISKLIKEEWRKINKDYSFIPSVEYNEIEHRLKSRRTELQERIYFYSTCRFFKEKITENVTENEQKNVAKYKYNNDYKIKYSRWMRVVHNLVRNYHFNEVADMLNCLRLINELADKVGGMDVYEYFTDLFNKINTNPENQSFDSKKDNFLNEIFEKNGEKSKDDSAKKSKDDSAKRMRFLEQLYEEAEKGVFILSKEQEFKKTLKIIEEAENYAFFEGTIRFLYRGNNGLPVWAKFKKKFKKAKKYFPYNPTEHSELEESEVEESKISNYNKIPVETMQAFLRQFKNFEEIAGNNKFYYSGKGYDDRNMCWKKNILCDDRLHEKLHNMFLNNPEPETLNSENEDEDYKAYKAFVDDEELLKDIMKKENGKFLLVSYYNQENDSNDFNNPNDGIIYCLKVKNNTKSKSYDTIYLGKTRKKVCKKLKEEGVEFKDEEKNLCKYYVNSGYIRGNDIQCKYNEYEFMFKVGPDNGQYIEVDGKKYTLSVDPDGDLSINDKTYSSLEVFFASFKPQE